jgi:DNA-binding transcriptional LysR family regulator
VTSPWELPDLVSLRLLVEALDRASIGGAARELGVSQPAASERLRALEQRLGVQLCIRSPRGVRPTPAGTVVRDWAADILAGAERLATGVAALRAEQAGQLRVAASLTVAEHLFPGWVHALRRAAPDAVVRLEVANSAEVAAALGAGRCDLGFIEGGSAPRTLQFRTVMHDRLTVVVAPSHRWARRRPPRVTPAELASTPLVVREEGSGTRDVLERALRLRTRRPSAHGSATGRDPGDDPSRDPGRDASRGAGTPPFRTALELGSTRAVTAAVLAGEGPAVVSVLAVAELLGRGELVAVDVEGIDLARRVRAVWREGHPPAGAAATLLAIASRTGPTLRDTPA